MDFEGQRLLQRLPDWLPERGRPAVLVTVWSVEGSAPRTVGARMLCRDGKLLTGTIGGGHLEQQALRDALHAAPRSPEIEDAERPTTAFTDSEDEADVTGNVARLCRYPLGPQLAQCCGGVVRLHYQPVDAVAAVRLAAVVLKAERDGVPFETPFGDGVLREQPLPLPTVLIFGGGHVAAALTRVLQTLPWRVVLVDARPEWADPSRFPRTTEVLCTEPLRLLAAWGWLGEQARGSQAAGRLSVQVREVPAVPQPKSTRAVVMTHDHALDRDLVEALVQLPLRTGDPERLAYVGMIGSRTKVAALHQRLRKRGVDEALLATVVAPIGLRVDGDLIGGKLPGEIAISLAAQWLVQGTKAPRLEPEPEP